MPTQLGAHNTRVDFARALLSKKGRREQRAFSFEGPTLLEEALRSGTPLQEVYATAAAYEQTELAAQLNARGVPVYIVDERTMRKISDVETPTGIVSVAPIRMARVAELVDEAGIVLALADVNDPGNAGTLLRSAEAFGVDRVIFGSLGAEPHHPKVVRAAMGAIFRVRIAVAAPGDLQALIDGWEVTGLASSGERLEELRWRDRSMLLVGNERHGIGRWKPVCTRLAGIPMAGAAESLNAAIAGSIGLYEATKRTFS